MTPIDQSRPGTVRATIAAILGTALLGGYVAQAVAADDLDEVSVTGSRIKRTTDFDTANPTTVVDADYLKQQGIVNVGDAMKSLPSNISNFSPTTTGNSNFFAGSTIANLRGLNPFFGSRTLNLVNGRRHVSTNQGDGVDLNFIPAILIDRMDVVTGGASAAYGSGAVSGVNNIFLNRKLDGVKVEADFGQSFHSDARDRHEALAFGSGFAEGRGHFTVGFEHQSMDAVGCMNVRSWCAKNVTQISNAAGGSYNSALGGWAYDPDGPGPTAAALVTLADAHPAQITVANARAPYTYAGVIEGPFSGALAQVNSAGTGLLPFAAGTGSPYFGSTVTGGDGRPVFTYTNLRSPVERNVATGTFSFKLTETINLTADMSWGRVQTDQKTGALDDGGFFGKGLHADNAYLLQQPALNAQMQPYLAFPINFVIPGVVNFPTQLNKDWALQTNPHSAFDTEVRRFSVGLDGKFGDSSWTWDGYYQYGKSIRTQLVADNRRLNAYDFAVDAVFDDRYDGTHAGFANLPQTQRPIECRITQQIRNGAVPANVDANMLLIAKGCAPLNMLGTAPIDAAAKAYAFGYLHETTTSDQQVLAFNTSGDLFAGFGAGTVKGAAGVEYRSEKTTNIGDQGGAPDYVRNDYLIQYGESFAGKVDVTEVYGEVNLPMLRDAALAKRLEFDVAARWSRYDNEGTLGPGKGISRSNDMTTWKVSGFWDPVDWLRVRGSQSRDSRAANARELYYGQIIHAGGWFGYCTPAGVPQGSPPDACTWSLEGNVNLKPETSDTTTIGFVLTPRDVVPGFELAVDYFHIKLTNAIQQANVSRVQQGCQISGIKEFCNLITPDATALASPNGAGNYNYNPANGTGIQLLRATSFNGSSYNYSGLDISSNYHLDLGAAGALNFRLLATRMFKQEFSPVPGQAPVNITGQTGSANSFLNDNNPSAKWNSTLTTSWIKGPFTASLNAHYIGEGKKDYMGVDPSDGQWYIKAPSNYVRYDDNHMPSYTVFGLNGNYRFENVLGAKTVDFWANISNLFDKNPPFGGGGFGAGPTQPIFYDTLGRSWKVGFRAAF